MNQKPIFRKYLTIAVSMMSMLIPALNIISIQTTHLSNEGPQTKNSNLLVPDAIIGVDNLLFYTNGNCDSINVYTKTLTSTCPTANTLDSLSYSINGGPVVVLISGGGNPPDSVLLGKFSVDSLSVRWYARENCIFVTPPPNTGTLTQTILIRDTIPPTAICRNVTLYLDALGNAHIQNPDTLDNGSSDACSGPLTFTTIPSNRFFFCNDVTSMPSPTLQLIVTDRYGNSSSCTSTITVLDTIRPTITCPATITINNDLNQCYATAVPSQIGTPTTSRYLKSIGRNTYRKWRP